MMLDIMSKLVVGLVILGWLLLWWHQEIRIKGCETGLEDLRSILLGAGSWKDARELLQNNATGESEE